MIPLILRNTRFLARRSDAMLTTGTSFLKGIVAPAHRPSYMYFSGRTNAAVAALVRENGETSEPHYRFCEYLQNLEESCNHHLCLEQALSDTSENGPASYPCYGLGSGFPYIPTEWIQLRQSRVFNLDRHRWEE